MGAEHMVTVAFWFDAPIEYTGGLNYLRNLLYALSLVNDGSVRPLVFFASDIPCSVEEDFARHATVVRVRVLQRRTLPWVIHKVVLKLTGRIPLVTRYLQAHGVSVVSHVWFVYRDAPFRILSWIPDFQYLHLPEFFPGLDTAAETRMNQQIIEHSDLVILSSESARLDYERIVPPGFASRGRVLRFVSQPRSADAGRRATRERMETTYGFHGRYFLLPNQFWAHKNHWVVLDAVKRLKEKGMEVLVLCTGNTRDYRLSGTRYLDDLLAVAKRDDLQDNFKVLGLIAYDDVLCLMNHAVAILNPSRFEGWSSSVEEAKSMGKPVVLSRIGVHVEQAPRGGRYFDVDDAEGLAGILEELWTSSVSGESARAEEEAKADLRERTIEFGRTYLALLKEVGAMTAPGLADPANPELVSSAARGTRAVSRLNGRFRVLHQYLRGRRGEAVDWLRAPTGRPISVTR